MRAALGLERAIVAICGGGLMATGMIAGRGYAPLGELPLGGIVLVSAAVARSVPALRWAALVIGAWFVFAPVFVVVGATRAVLDVIFGLAIASVSVVTLDNTKAAALGDRGLAPRL
jgi:hypothetical protein